MSDGTDLTYGVYKLENCVIEQFAERAVYDPSNTDLLHSEFEITVSSVVMGENLGKTLGATLTSGTTPAEVIRAFRTSMMHPRRDFKLELDGQTIIETSGTDADNGPKPVACEITRAAPASYNVRYTIRVALIQCASIGIDPVSGDPVPFAVDVPNVVNHKWNYEETVDDKWFRRRTWNGTIRVRDRSTPPDVYRRLFVPPLAAGFRVESMRFSTEPNGLNGAYQIVHVACDAAAPWPAMRWGGSHFRSLGIDGYKQEAFYQVWMEGAPGVDKVMLLARCFQAVNGRIGNIGADFKLTDGSGTIATIRNVQIGHAENDTRVELRINVDIQPGNGDPTALGLNFQRFGEQFDQFPGYNRLASTPLDPVDPDLPLGAFAAYLQSPCGGPKSMPQIVGVVPQPEGDKPILDDRQEEQRAQPEPSAQYFIVPEVPQDPEPTKSKSIEQSPNFYQAYEITSRYERDGGRAVFPIQKQLSSYDGPTIVVVDRHEPVMMRVVEILAERTGARPALPSRNDVSDSDRDEILLRDKILAETAHLEPDGRTLLYCVKARYEYALTKPIAPNQEMKTGRPPMLKADGTLTRWKLEDEQDDDITEG